MRAGIAADRMPCQFPHLFKSGFRDRGQFTFVPSWLPRRKVRVLARRRAAEMATIEEEANKIIKEQEREQRDYESWCSIQAADARQIAREMRGAGNDFSEEIDDEYRYVTDDGWTPECESASSQQQLSDNFTPDYNNVEASPDPTQCSPRLPGLIETAQSFPFQQSIPDIDTEGEPSDRPMCQCIC